MPETGFIFPLDIINKKRFQSKRTDAKLKILICYVSGCGVKHYALGLCNSHWSMKRRGSDINKPKWDSHKGYIKFVCTICGNPRWEGERQSLCKFHSNEKNRIRQQNKALKLTLDDRLILREKFKISYQKNREKRLLWQRNYYKRNHIKNVS